MLQLYRKFLLFWGVGRLVVGFMADCLMRDIGQFILGGKLKKIHLLKSFAALSNFIFNFSYPCMVAKMSFLGQIYEEEIFGDLIPLRSPKFKNCILAFELCVCVLVRESVCVTVITLEKNKLWKKWKLAFYTRVIFWYYLKVFIKLGQIICLQGHT